MQPTPSAAAQVIVTIIPLVGIVAGCTVIFFSLLWNYKQKLLMIEKGLVKQKAFDLDAFSLFSGIILFSIGSSLVTFFIIKEGFTYGVLGGLIPLSIGFGLILYFVIRQKMNNNNNEK
ncbi:MAG: hypothetical protein GY754_47080 [bacterium]|nr:hypothetical protein [bacterium]